jgi:hypothetical protein
MYKKYLSLRKKSKARITLPYLFTPMDVEAAGAEEEDWGEQFPFLRLYRHQGQHRLHHQRSASRYESPDSCSTAYASDRGIGMTG